MAAKVASKSSAMEVEDSISHGSIEVCRLMHPDDANIAGNVHGGTILKLIEEGGFIIATRHCNKNRLKDDELVLAALARVERTDFLLPMYIGEVAQVHVELGYASKRSLEVKAFVWAENLGTGNRRLTNSASLWYVPVVWGSDLKVIPEVPALKYSSKEEEERGKARYEMQKRARLDKEEHLQEVNMTLTSRCTMYMYTYIGLLSNNLWVNFERDVFSVSANASYNSSSLNSIVCEPIGCRKITCVCVQQKYFTVKNKCST